MADDFDKKLRRWREAVERGSWRQTLRANFAPLFDDLEFGFQCGDGWSEVICAMAAEIAGIVGGPARAPELRVVQLKEKLGQLRVYIQGMPEAQAAAVHAAITRAEEKSVQICEACGRPGRLRQSRDGYRYTACDRHVVD